MIAHVIRAPPIAARSLGLNIFFGVIRELLLVPMHQSIDGNATQHNIVDSFGRRNYMERVFPEMFFEAFIQLLLKPFRQGLACMGE
mgnify:FL=1